MAFTAILARRSFEKALPQILLIASLIALLGNLAGAQTTSSTDGSTPLAISPGAPMGSYPLSSFENINPYNGNLNFHLPLVGISGRGGAQITSFLEVDNKNWNVKHRVISNGDVLDTPGPNRWTRNAGYGPGLLVGRQSGVDNWQCGSGNNRYMRTITRLTFTTGDGTEYDFRDQLTGGQPAAMPSACASGASRGTVFITADGTAATFISDAIINDAVSGTGLIYPSGYLMLRDGTRFRIDSGNVTWMRDRNGNRLNFTYDASNRVLTITDSLRRQVTFAYADGTTTLSDQITFQGFGGASRTILINYANLSSALRTTNPRNEPASRYQIQTHRQLFPLLNNASSSTSYNPSLVSSVTLPNGKQYQFSYNCYGELARVTLPTGGAIEYDYTAGSGVVDGINPEIYRRAIERRVYSDASNLESYATFSDLSSGVAMIDQLSGGGTLLSRTKHYFYGDPGHSFFQRPIDYPARFDGLEYKTETYAADGLTLLRSAQMNWVNRAPVSWWPNPGAADEPPNDPRVSDTTSALTDVTPNLVSKKVYGYDDSVPYNNQNDVKEYGFGSGSHGGLVRETTTSFVTSGTYTGTNVHLRSLPMQSSVYDASGIERARTTYEYDNYSTDANHASLVNRTNVSGFDSTFNTSYTTRGNATATTNYLLTNGTVTSSISNYLQYDIAGNAVKAIDARGNATTLDFNDRFGAPDGDARTNAGSTELNQVGQYSYALATSVTNALGHTSYLQFDYYVGRPVDAEDANGTIYSGYSNNDSLDRPTKLVRAVNYASLKSQSTFSYDDTNRIVTVTSDKDVYGDNLLKGQTFYDGLGRTIESRTYENSNDYIAVRQVPFVLLQDPDTSAWVAASQTSNPFRPYLSEQAVWTTKFSDALGRTTKVKTPDSAIARTLYSGNTLTVSDQTGKARRSVNDALGRMIEVDEDPSGVNWSTIYTYDVLNNLTQITQGSQPARTFVYDSLKRLSAATNPENGTITYQYDNNGNQLVSTQARDVSSYVSTHFSYDALNRPMRRWYNGSSSTTATTHNSPAIPSGVGTSNEAKFFYDSQTLPSIPPNFSRGFATGRLVAVTYGTGGDGDYFGYDELGRSVLKIQQIGIANYYKTTASYSIGGTLTSEIYPSGHTVSYGYDAAGRTSSFSGNLGDSAQRTYSTGMVYSSLGGMTREQFGTDTALYNKLFYNVRGQVAEMRVGTYNATDGTWWNRGAIINHYSDGCWGMCGGSNSTTSMTDNNGNLKKQEVYIPNDEQITGYATWWQGYYYDNLNRLTQVKEYSGTTPIWQQVYTIDRWGNRTIDYNNTSSSMPRPQFGVDTNTNRLTAPTGSTMSYDAAGNLTNDTYTGQGQRIYDVANRMTQAWSNSQWQTYTYDASGQRVRRNVNGVETWGVYGLGGELLAEYAATNPGVMTPLKEYGYRNGQLLVTATGASGSSSSQNVTWTNAVGVSISGNSITKNAATAWGNSGAVSNQSLTSGDGYVEFTPTFLSGIRECGLSNGDSNQNYTDIDFGIYLGAWNMFSVYENGVAKYSNGPYATTDRFRVAVEGGIVKYYRNGTLFYTSTGTPTYPLLVDTALYTNGTPISNVVLTTASGAPPEVKWFVSDQLGTPRMIFSQSGSLASASRHDYLPFGEELYANTGLRTSTQGYTVAGNQPADKTRQKYTGYEYDGETLLNYAHARYHSSAQGRFTSADSFGGWSGNPQSLNRYAYVANNPMNYSDPTGHAMFSANTSTSPNSGGSGFGDPDFIAGPSSHAANDMAAWEQSIKNTRNSIAPSGGSGSTSGSTTAHESGHIIDTAADEGSSQAESGTPQNPSAQDLVNSGTSEAAARLEIEPCAAFFGGTAKGLKALNGLKFTADPSMNANGHPQAELQPNDVDVTVNTHHVPPAGGGGVTPNGVAHEFILVDPKTSNIRVLTLYGVEARGFVQLHETGHKARRFGNSDIDGRGNYMNGYRNNFKIWQACFGGVSTQPWRGHPPFIP